MTKQTWAFFELCTLGVRWYSNVWSSLEKGKKLLQLLLERFAKSTSLYLEQGQGFIGSAESRYPNSRVNSPGCLPIMSTAFFCFRDHAGGNEAIVKLITGLTVCGGDDRIGALNKKVSHGDEFKVGQAPIKHMPRVQWVLVSNSIPWLNRLETSMWSVCSLLATPLAISATLSVLMMTNLVQSSLVSHPACTVP